MHKKLLTEAEKYAKQNQLRRIWRKIVRFMACIVVFCTTYALILPAITLEKSTQCQLEEHTHSESCYSKVTSEQLAALTCTYESLGVHVHTQDCCDAENDLQCGYADYLVHEHDASCIDETGVIVCRLPEVEEHVHSDDCYQAMEAEPVSAEIAEETQVHTHDDTCYSVEQGELICQIHTHSDGCYTRGSLVCDRKEMEGHAHDEGCRESVLGCDLTVEPHVHDETACYQQRVCELPEGETHAHSEACNGLVLNCDLAEQAHYHTDACYQTNSLCDLPEQEGHSHVDECYESVLGCGGEAAEDHQHTGDCYAQIRTLICQLGEGVPTAETEATDPTEAAEPEWELICDKDIIQLHSHTEACSETYLDDNGAERTRLICAETVVEKHIHSESCFETTESPVDTEVLTCTETAEDHVHAAMCYGTWELTCGSEAHIHDDQCTPLLGLSEEDRAKVEQVIALIEALPTLDEVTAQAETMDPDSEEYQSWFSELSWSARVANDAYEALSEELRQFVPDTAKMDDLAWTWQTAVLAEDTVVSIDVYLVNSCLYTQTEADSLTTIIYGGSANEVVKDTDVRDYAYWHAIVVEKENDGFYVGSIDRRQAADAVKYNIAPETKGGFVLLVAEENRDKLATVEVGQSVQISPHDFYKTKKSTTTYAGTITFTKPKDNSKELTIVNSASTRDLITLNLFNYGANINENWQQNKKYPGFQSPAASAIADAGRMDFGNSITAEIGNSDVQGPEDHRGAINKWLVINNEGTINYPISGAIKSELVNGYPALAADGTSLVYLFSDNSYATKANSEHIDGLFQYDEETGKYTFDSRKNAAVFNAKTSTFTLYEQIMTPNFIIYPFGNFLPLNDIRTQTTQTTQIDQDWFAEVAASAQQKYHNGMGDEYQTLYKVLTAFDGTMDTYVGSSSWDYHNAVEKYFDSVVALPEAPPRDDARFSNMYTIDYDEPTDFFFGMSMHMDFMQPKDGLTGPDGKQPMEYTFAGDDDVWIYVDGKLFLDLSGIHRHVGGQIDFVKGEVRYYELLPETGDVNTEPYKTVKFKDILGTATGLNEKGTFADYSSHTMDFYYMERGSGSSVCKMEFNLPLLKKNSISVTKENTAVKENGTSDSTALGNPDYYFNIVNNDNALFVGPGSVTGVTQYKVMDSGGNILKNADGTDKVFTTDDYGIFTLKAGQTAVFEGISEDKGTYFVQELIKDEDNAQYDSVYVNDSHVDDELIKWDDRAYFSDDDGDTHTGPYGYKWHGYSSGATDSSSQSSFYFKQQNHVDVSKLAKLSITKALSAEITKPNEDAIFKMYVTLDGTPLPVGTAYTVGETPKTVAAEGIVELKAGETATISNIISGTKFEIYEHADSASGYFVSYGENTGEGFTGSDDFAVNDGVATGVVRVNTHVGLVVTNSEQAASVDIPVLKKMSQSGGLTKERSYTFTLQQVVSKTDLNAADGGTTKTVTLDFTAEREKKTAFTLEYTPASLTDPTENEGKKTQAFYYTVTEAPFSTNEVLLDSTTYLAEVTVALTDSAITAQLTGFWKVGEENALTDVTAATFTNTLVRNLHIAKQVEGSQVSKEKRFSFTGKITTGSSNAAIPGELAAVLKTGNSDGSETFEAANITLDADGTFTFTLKHNQTLLIYGIPYKADYEIVETDAEGFKVTYTQQAYNDPTSGTSTTASGSVEAPDTTVTFTNTQLYELPQTGGAGITTYTMAGLMLMLLSAAYLLYRFSKRRREAV